MHLRAQMALAHQAAPIDDVTAEGSRAKHLTGTSCASEAVTNVSHSMMPSHLGRHVFGLAAITLGVVGLVFADFAAVWQPVPPSVPQRHLLAYAMAACLLTAGAAVQYRPTAKIGLLALAALYTIAALLWVPRIAAHPALFSRWSGFAEELCLVIAALLSYESLADGTGRRASAVFHVGRVLFGVCVISFGIAHFTALEETARLVPNWLPFGQRFWAIATGLMFLSAGIALVGAIRPALVAGLLTIMILSFGWLIWAPALASKIGDHFLWAANAINFAIAGAAWMVADVHQTRIHPATARSSPARRP